MAKHYDLVGSYYDKFAKGNKYKEEEIIKIPGVTLNSLEDIDKFTSSMSLSSFYNRIDKNYQNKNTISIRVTKSDGSCYYQSVIFNTKDLASIIDSIKKSKVYRNNGYNTIKKITTNNPLFNNAWLEVESKIINKDKKWLYGVFNDKNYLTLINRYVNGDTYDSEAVNLLVELKEGFREYSVFRKYLTNKDKKKDYRRVSKVQNINIIEENIPQNTSLKKYDAKSTNYIPIDDDKEEFFDDKEIEMMAGEGNIPYKFTGRRI